MEECTVVHPFDRSGISPFTLFGIFVVCTLLVKKRAVFTPETRAICTIIPPKLLVCRIFDILHLFDNQLSHYGAFVV